MAGFSFGTTTPAPAPAAGGFTFGNPAAAPAAAPSTTPASSFFGNGTAAAPSAATTVAAAATVTASSGSTVYTSLPPQAQQAIMQIHDMSLRQRRTLASIEKMAPRLLSGNYDLNNQDSHDNHSEEKKEMQQQHGSDDENSYLPLQIEAMMSNLQAIVENLERRMGFVKGLQGKARDGASYALSEASWPMEALAARRGVQLSSTKFDGADANAVNDPNLKKKMLERKVESMLDREAAMIDRREQVPSKFVWELLKSFEERVGQTKREIEIFERQLKLVQASNADSLRGYERQRQHEFSREDIASIYEVQNGALLRVAGKIASMNDQVETLRRRWRRYHGKTGDDIFRKADALDVTRRNEKEARLRTIMLSTRPQPSATSQGGSLTATVAPTSGTMFGAKPTSTSGLFGSSTSNSTGGFGAKSATPTSVPAGGSLFGTAPAPTGGSLFGASGNTGGGLFGTNSTPAQTGGGLFGSSAPAPAGGGLFGTSATPAPAPTGGSLFGGSAPAPAGGSLFGGSAPAPAGGGLFGSSGTATSSSGLSRSSSSRSKGKGRSRR